MAGMSGSRQKGEFLWTLRGLFQGWGPLGRSLKHLLGQLEVRGPCLPVRRCQGGGCEYSTGL